MRRVILGFAIALAAIAPGGLRADDQQIAQKIVTELKALQAAGKLRGFKIDLAVEDGTVLLKGRVASPEQQALALEVAQKTAGVKQVVNDLKVEPLQAAANPATETRSLFKNPLKRATTPNQNPVATSREARDRPAQRPSSPELGTPPTGSESLASSQPGAPQVVIESSSPTEAAAARPAISDEQIARQIYDRLQQFKESGHLHGFRLDMRVQDGTVILDGHMPAVEQKTLALEVARRVPGVYQVVDMIRVEPPAGQFHTVSTGADSARRRPAPEPTRIAPPQPSTSILARPNPSVGPSVSTDAAKGPQPATAPEAQSDPSNVAGTPTAPHLNNTPHTVAVTPTSPPMALVPVPEQALVPVPQLSANAPRTTHAPAVVAIPSAMYYNYQPAGQGLPAAAPIASGYGAVTGGIAQVRYDHPQLPNYAWPSYAAYPNYAAVTYPKQYSPAAWPYIGPFYPYPQVPLGWRKVTLEWDDGWWQLDFKSK